MFRTTTDVIAYSTTPFLYNIRETFAVRASSYVAGGYWTKFKVGCRGARHLRTGDIAIATTIDGKTTETAVLQTHVVPSITTTVHGGRPEVLRPRTARRFW